MENIFSLPGNFMRENAYATMLEPRIVPTTFITTKISVFLT